MRIYRIEHPSDGQGPYMSSWDMDSPRYGRLSDLAREIGWAHSDRSHPSPQEDPGLGCWPADHEFCGLRTEQDVKVWFDGFLDRLDRLGYELRVYECDEDFVRGTGRQVLFAKDTAALVEVLPLTSSNLKAWLAKMAAL